VVLELTALAELRPDAHLVVTGEGSLDAQTLHGKAPAGIADAAGSARSRPVGGRHGLRSEGGTEDVAPAGQPRLQYGNVPDRGPLLGP
jgi:hypothetical protein